MSIVKIRAALQNALYAIGETIPSCSITSSAPGTSVVFTTSTPHNFVTGISSTISSHVGSTPDLNGVYDIVVQGTSSFSIVHSVTKSAVASTVAGTGGLVTPNLTAWENVAFAPVPLVPYQKVNFLFARPENPTFGGSHSRENGFMQVTLYYPAQRGSSAIDIRAEAIRSIFYRGASFTKDSIVVHIPGKPEIVIIGNIGNDYVVIVKIPFWCDIFS